MKKGKRKIIRKICSFMLLSSIIIERHDVDLKVYLCNIILRRMK